MKILENPYSQIGSGSWLRGNIHAHSTRSDGRRSPQAVVEDYAARGYDFLMLSDHDVCSTPADLAALPSGDMVLLPGNEISAQGSHILHVNATRAVAPHSQRQRVFNEIVSDPESFAVVCHPNWLYGCPGAAPSRAQLHPHTTFSQLAEWVGYAGLEIYNGAAERLDGSACATDVWDLLLASGRRIWGFANDDSHRAEGDIPLPSKVDHTPLMRSDMELGWNVVWARKSPAAIAQALREGRFYASTGVEISKITAEGMRLRIETKDAECLVALRETGRCFARVEGSAIEVEVPEDASYVRFEARGRGGRVAWTQPFFVREQVGEGEAPAEP